MCIRDSVYLAIYGAGRFAIRYMRTDPAVFLVLRQAQVASLLMVVIALIVGPILLRRARANGAPAQAIPESV